MKGHKRLLLGVAVLATISICQWVVADTVLPLDGNPKALPGFSGTQNFSDGSLNADIQFAVFGPGDFAALDDETFSSLALGGYDAANDYVYAYLIDNNVGGTSVVTSLDLTPVGTVSDLGEDPFNPAGGVSPSAVDPALTTFWFTNPQIVGGSESTVLLLSSPQGPTFTQANLFNAGYAAAADLPTPIPLPAAAWLALPLLGGIGLLRRVRRKE